MQEAGRDIPTLSGVRDDGDSLLVITGENANDRGPTLWLKRDVIPDLEIEHPFMRSRLVQESQPLDDPVVEIDEFCFGEAVDINSHHDSLPPTVSDT